LESDPNWYPPEDVRDSAGDDTCTRWGFSTGDSDPDENDTNDILMAEVGEYTFGPRTEEEYEFWRRYAEGNWHAKSWELLPREQFSGSKPGLAHDYGATVPSPIQCFLLLWDDKI
jgi:hypothetical protein